MNLGVLLKGKSLAKSSRVPKISRVRPPKNRGIIVGKHLLDRFGADVPFFVRNTAGDWTIYQPPAENQYSNNTDTMACVSYSMCHCVETQIKFLTGKTVDLSERFLAKVSGTTQQGNYQAAVANALMSYGLVSQDDWPVPDNFTWDSYYADIPQTILDKGKLFLNDWNIQYGFIDASNVSDRLKQAPLQVIITQEYPHHAVELVNLTTYFDQYEPYNKQVGTVHDYLEVLITPKNKKMTQDEVKHIYMLAFYRLPDADELAYWTDKQLIDFLKQAITDRANFLTQNN